jgi:hypothetical protein
MSGIRTVLEGAMSEIRTVLEGPKLGPVEHMVHLNAMRGTELEAAGVVC